MKKEEKTFENGCLKTMRERGSVEKKAKKKRKSIAVLKLYYSNEKKMDI